LQAENLGRVREVDVSEVEALLSTLPYPMLMAQRMRRLGLPANLRSAPMLGVVRAADGWVGINCLTGQHWLDVCAMLGLPEYGEHQIAIMLGGPERDEFLAKAEPMLATQTVAEVVELGQALRIPAAPVIGASREPLVNRTSHAKLLAWSSTSPVPSSKETSRLAKTARSGSPNSVTRRGGRSSGCTELPAPVGKFPPRPASTPNNTASG
jgi:crotonobetainyl-CoA:carnitine CoA-transferase CaiB-like acyl-CoA transferase